ncbi:Ftsk gamma domain protein [compost metagenome]
MSAHQGEKDQKPLSFDSEDAPAKPASKPRSSKAKSAGDIAKAIEIPPKLLEQARDFVTIQQNPTIAGLQNQLKIGMEKAIAILERLTDEGAVLKIGEGKDVKFELVRNQVIEVRLPGEVHEVDIAIDFDATTLTDELYAKLVEKVRETGSATTGALAIAFDLDMELAELAVERMQSAGLIDEEGKVIPEKELNME